MVNSQNRFSAMLRSSVFCRTLSWVLAAAGGVSLVLAILGRPVLCPFLPEDIVVFLPLFLWNILLLRFPATPRRQKFDHASRWCLAVSVVLMVVTGVVYIRYSSPQWVRMESVLYLFFIPIFLSQFYSGCILPWEDTTDQ